MDTLSLFEPIYHDGGDALFVMDQVSDKKSLDENWIEEISLREAISKLSGRERVIMQMRFGLGSYKEHTQKEVASIIGISQSYISRLEKKIISKLKKDIDSISKTYDTAENQLTQGRGNIIKRLENLKTLGVTPKKQLDADYLDKAE